MSEVKRGDRNLSKYKLKNALLFHFCETRSQDGGGGEESLTKSGHIQNLKLREKEHSLTGFFTGLAFSALVFYL